MPTHSPAAASPMPMLRSGVRTLTAGADGHEFVNANPSRDGRKPEQPGTVGSPEGGKPERPGTVGSPEGGKPERPGTVSLPGPSAGGQAVDPRHFGGIEREAEQVQVGRDPLGLR